MKPFIATILCAAILLMSVGSGYVHSSERNDLGPKLSSASDKDIIVYITKTGEKYHRESCHYLSKSKIPIKLKDAKAGGYSPCKVCKPPET